MSIVPEPPKDVGASIPAHTPHAVSVMFPKWQDNIMYEEGDPRVTSKMECGYPRFFIHPLIQKLCAQLLAKFGKPTESGMLFPSRKVAERCREFIKRYYPEECTVRIVEFVICPPEDDTRKSKMQSVPVYMVLFPKEAFKVAKQFWQHSGDIFSSRMAEYGLRILDMTGKSKQSTKKSTDEAATAVKRAHPRYTRKALQQQAEENNKEEEEQCEAEHLTYLEERYGRNLPLEFADHAKVALRRRIAGIITDEDSDIKGISKATPSELESQRALQGDRGMKGLSEDDVYLYPCGMSAIFHAHQSAMAVGDDSRKSVCFGFPYTDTLKILQKFGAGCHFYGQGDDKSIDELETLLASGERILALFCEVPSNPLLKSPDLKRLRQLADEYDFMIVVDETIGNFCNVGVLEYADMVVSSLTKVFSGDSNVMGGSMVLNPKRKYYDGIKKYQEENYEDLVWCEDALFLERNSRNFKARSQIINENAEALCDYLSTHPKVSSVYYPKFVCREHYDVVKRPEGGYGGLFSMELHSEKAAQQFYDNLHCAKGPSLGTNFTLASPYTILAHYTELDWAEQFGVSRYLVRVSVGLEERQNLLDIFKKALDAIE